MENELHQEKTEMNGLKNYQINSWKKNPPVITVFKVEEKTSNNCKERSPKLRKKPNPTYMKSNITINKYPLMIVCI